MLFQSMGTYAVEQFIYRLNDICARIVNDSESDSVRKKKRETNNSPLLSSY